MVQLHKRRPWLPWRILFGVITDIQQKGALHYLHRTENNARYILRNQYANPRLLHTPHTKKHIFVKFCISSYQYN